ncbi:MAG: Lrp/AsnC family transcriptional regulator, partial [Desulfatirhabdiaceae bacterium]
RNPAPGWPYNLYTMIHARDEASCIEIARKISVETDVGDYELLFSRKEMKKTSMEYFRDDEVDSD